MHENAVELFSTKRRTEGNVDGAKERLKDDKIIREQYPWPYYVLLIEVIGVVALPAAR